MRVRRSRQAVSDIAFRLGMKFPRLLRALLPLLGRVLPNLWIFNRFMRELKFQIPVTTRLGNGMRVRAFLGDMIGCHISRSGYYEEHVVRAVLERVEQRMVFFDIGANIGQYTLLASRAAREVHSFEPMPSTCGLLQESVRRNKLRNVFVNECALSNFEGSAELFEASGNAGESSLRPPEHASGRVFKVRCTTLDRYVVSQKLILEPRQAFIKIDAEGAEKLILEGATQVLSLRPTIIFELIGVLQASFGSSPMQIVDLLRNMQYRFFDVQPSSCLPLMPEKLHDFSGNVLAVPHGLK